MLLDCWRTPHKKVLPSLKPRSCVLWGNSANHSATLTHVFFNDTQTICEPENKYNTASTGFPCQELKVQFKINRKEQICIEAKLGWQVCQERQDSYVNHADLTDKQAEAQSKQEGCNDRA